MGGYHGVRGDGGPHPAIWSGGDLQSSSFGWVGLHCEPCPSPYPPHNDQPKSKAGGDAKDHAPNTLDSGAGVQDPGSWDQQLRS